LKKYSLAKKRSLIIKARDGLDIPCYLTLPVGMEEKNLPTVLFVHGGPSARDEMEYDPIVQLFANRGYAVLQVNFRGSAGFGKKFQNLGDGQMGVGSMQHDLTDAVHHLIKSGIADPDRIGIIGGSYGGYATLAGLTFTPELYSCGVSICGLSDIKTFLKSIPPYWVGLKKMLTRLCGDVEKDEELNKRISPLYHIDKIRAPLLIVHGLNDPRSKKQQSDQIVSAMREKKIPVTYVVYPDEGHGLVRPENKIDLWGRIEAFFAHHLRGRSEPFGKIEGSSAELH
jgi:dipeptidyl aminopeptidase/acylaminoacyl peptidase